jgi:glutamate synthase (NADPH/NADH) large chain
MSGGIAYIYDVKNQFHQLCNKEMVDLDPLSSEDAEELIHMITQHYQLTNSTVAKFVLDDFDNQVKNFIKVFPKDYKRVLQVKAQHVQVG